MLGLEHSRATISKGTTYSSIGIWKLALASRTLPQSTIYSNIYTTYGCYNQPFLQTFQRGILARELEAYFDYGEYQIRLIDAPEVSDKAASAVVLRRNMSPGFVRGLIERARGKDLVVESVFPSREDLLTNFQFLGMTIEEMWPDLDYFGPAYYFSDIGYLYSVLKGVWFF